MSQEDFEIIWNDAGRYAQVPPNPSYPDGVDIRCGEPHAKEICKVHLPYPAPRCGFYFVRCRVCDVNIVITTAGRPDDPRSVEVACRPHDRYD